MSFTKTGRTVIAQIGFQQVFILECIAYAAKDRTERHIVGCACCLLSQRAGGIELGKRIVQKALPVSIEVIVFCQFLGGAGQHVNGMLSEVLSYSSKACRLV